MGLAERPCKSTTTRGTRPPCDNSIVRPQSPIVATSLSGGRTIFTLDLFAVGQGLLGARVFARMLPGAAGDPLVPVDRAGPDAGRAAAIVPVLNEESRLGPCLEGLRANGPALERIVVVDGGSSDGTRELVRAAAVRDPRIELLEVAPVPADWNGKAWGLACGMAHLASGPRWIVTLDADVRPAPNLISSLVTHAERSFLRAFSAAPRQRVSGALQGVLHPALLATLVYRFGVPGGVATRSEAVQANGQCFFVERALLESTHAIDAAKASPCDDVTIARTLVRSGVPVGFFEAGDLATVAMYPNAAECWENWPRSLTLRDASTSTSSLVLQFAEIAFVQGAPLLVALALLATGRRRSLAFAINAALALARLGVLAGTRRAYAEVAPTFWLSPLADLPAAFALARSAVAKTHRWRGRALVLAETSAL
jgi:dolichol-phosphate mannosyltransferase